MDELPGRPFQDYGRIRVMHSRRGRLLRSIVAAVLCAALETIAAAAQPAPGTPTYSISGTVVDQQGGLPVSGAHLQLMQAAKVVAGTISDASGKFSFPAVPQGVYNIQVTAAGY